ncbi:MAG: hypothetical protein HYR56_14880 [Acidobacteria bacterium]|nr:hypothetical protein [Acidobacteriota bacterium]MBI3422069.1 hypothetical protein [Acidobacteriota bacterium]
MNTKIEAISMSLLLALSLGVFSLVAAAQDKPGQMDKMDGMKMGQMKMKPKMEMVIGKKGILNFTSSFHAGDTVLKSGTYQVQHVEEGSDHHIIVLKEVPSGQGFRGGNTMAGKEAARLHCKFEPSEKKWSNTTVMLRTNDKGEKEIAEIHVAGEKFVHKL